MTDDIINPALAALTGVQSQAEDAYPECENLIGEYVDTHCHFDADDFADQQPQLWQACCARGVKTLIIPGVEPAQWQTAAQLSQRYSGIYYAVGIHPWWIEKILPDSLLNNSSSQHSEMLIDDDWRRDLHTQVSAKNCVAIGECGLDGTITTPMVQQQQLFELHLQLAQELTKPLIIHSVKAHNDVFALLKKYRPRAGGVIHAFSGSLQQAQAYWQLGFYLGVGGTITYERAKKTRHAVTELPLEAIVLETDAPYMPLSGRQGEPNRPDYLPDIAHTLAQLRGQSLHHIAQQTTHNAKHLFGI